MSAGVTQRPSAYKVNLPIVFLGKVEVAEGNQYHSNINP